MPEPEKRLVIVKGDLTAEAVTAVVNPANTDLVLGAGVAGAIRTRGGSAIQAECDRLAPLKLGDAVVTTGGKLPSPFVIHAAVMQLGGAPDETSIRQSVTSALEVARRQRFQTVAFPALGTGVGGFPMERAAAVILPLVLSHLAENQHPSLVKMVLFDQAAFDVWQATFNDLNSRRS